MTDTPKAETPETPETETAEHSAPMADIALPDRLAADPSSPFHNPELLAMGIGVRFKGVEKTNVEEYCVSEGWIRVAAGRALDRRGQPLTVKLRGTVEPYFHLEA